MHRNTSPPPLPLVRACNFFQCILLNFKSKKEMGPWKNKCQPNMLSKPLRDGNVRVVVKVKSWVNEQSRLLIGPLLFSTQSGARLAHWLNSWLCLKLKSFRLRSAANMNGQCTEEEREAVWDSLPRCQPRNILVSIPHPTDPDIIQVSDSRQNSCIMFKDDWFQSGEREEAAKDKFYQGFIQLFCPLKWKFCLVVTHWFAVHTECGGGSTMCRYLQPERQALSQVLWTPASAFQDGIFIITDNNFIQLIKMILT